MSDDSDRAAAGGVTRVGADAARWALWAPRAKTAELVLDPGTPAESRRRLEPAGRGEFAVVTPGVEPGRRYGFAIDGGATRPDPLSRSQPDGVDRPSAVVFPGDWTWDDGGWKGIERRDLVFYELCVNTFTPEGTFDAVHPPPGEPEGISASRPIELMPVAQISGLTKLGVRRGPPVRRRSRRVRRARRASSGWSRPATAKGWRSSST